VYATVERNDYGWMDLPAGVLRQFQELAASVEKRSQIVWAEHCSECAFPSCYSTCAFYTPRRDLHCRRFEDGIRQDEIGGVGLARIGLRKWAKLEGVGPARLLDAHQARRREGIDRSVTALITKAPLPQITYARAARYWNQWKSPERPQAADAPPDAFVLEALLAAGPAMPFTLTILPIGQTHQGFFQRGLTIEPGYNRIVVPQAEIAARVDIAKPYLIQIEPVGEASGRELVFGLIEFVRFKDGIAPAMPAAAPGAAASAGKQKRLAKCVVWDLDNTVWKGTLAEDGQEALQLKPEVAAIMVELDRRGILQSVASKNDAEPALAALEAFGVRQYLLFPQVGWGPKSDSLRRIAEMLDIGLDTFVFIDDEPFERGEVVAALPMVTVLPEQELPELLANPLFDVPATAEGSKRRKMYQVEELRQATFAGSGTDYLSFLRGCNIELTIQDLSQEHAERAYELSQRTNQLNFSGTKYARSDIAAFLRPDSRESVLLLRCADKFGDYGIIGMCVLDPARGRVQSFMMSCRVQRKRVEQAFFAWLTKRIAADRGVIEIAYRKTARNGASVRMLEELGFTFQPTAGQDAGLYVRPAREPFADDNVVHVDDRTKVTADAA
jgi:FkbH-like protein